MLSNPDVANEFLSKAGWGDAKRTKLAGDASDRVYDRLVSADASKSAVLMKVPPESSGEIELFARITNALVQMGFSAPLPLAVSAENGLLLIEDFGDDLIARLCETNPETEVMLYEAAVDVLVDLAAKPVPEWLSPYDMATYLRETRLLTEWYLPAATGQQTSSVMQAKFDTLIQRACAPLLDQKQVMVLRDYHSENLLWLPERSGSKKIGLLDYQDTLAGHPAYDLMSLLEDARRDTTTRLREDMIARYISKTGVDAKQFRQAYDALGMQRNIKILGIFARLCMRDGKPGYVDLMPRVWDHLQNDLASDQLEDIRNWVTKNVPAPTTDIKNKIKEACA